ncbi:MAG: hypothetical protein ACFFAX_14130, partial [Promethearchaeota archaeon]
MLVVELQTTHCSSRSLLALGWCVDYFRKYGEPPNKSIEGIFEAWSSKDRDDETVNLVSRFLSDLSGEYESSAEEINGKYLVDLAGQHFNKVRLERLSDGIRGDLDAGDLEAAMKRADEHGRVEVGHGTAIDVLADADAIREAFQSQGESIVQFPGALGEFYGDALERDGFIAFMASNKRGKSWRLIDLAWRAMLQRRKVAFFEAGDMARDQVMRRLMVRASRRPMRARSIDYPVGISHNGGKYAALETEERSWEKPLD